MHAIIRLLRPLQWYKNLVIFLPLIFSSLLFDSHYFSLTVLGFIALCLISSANYIINDIIDAKKDALHPEKRTRPVASGKVSKPIAALLAMVLAAISLIIAISQGIEFFLVVLFIFALTQAYTFFLKNEPYIDILCISVNFVARAVSGAYIIGREISPWLILCPFFIALFLALGKRYSEAKFLAEDAAKHRAALAGYNTDLTNAWIIISTTAVIISYSLYAFLSNHHTLLLITLPFAIYVIMRYLSLIYSGSKVARNTELMYRDRRLMAGIVLWAVLTFLLLYSNTLMSLLPW